MFSLAGAVFFGFVGWRNLFRAEQVCTRLAERNGWLPMFAWFYASKIGILFYKASGLLCLLIAIGLFGSAIYRLVTY